MFSKTVSALKCLRPFLNLSLLFLTKANHHVTQQLSYSDAEGDTVKFKQISAPTHGTSKLLEDGWLYYEPNEYYFGQDQLIVQMTETNLPKGVQGNIVEEEIMINVREIPFAPRLYFASMVDSQHLSTGTIQISTEGNTVNKPIGDIYLCDYNPSDSLGILQTVSDGNVTATMETAAFEDEVVSDEIKECFARNQYVARISIVTDEEYHGVVNNYS